MYKVELVASGGVVVGFFEVEPDIPLSSLSARLGEAVRAEDPQSVIYWQILRPCGRILFQAKSLDGVCVR